MIQDTLPPCPKCASVYTYEDGALLVCSKRWRGASWPGGLGFEACFTGRKKLC